MNDVTQVRLQNIVGNALAGPKMRRSFRVGRGWSSTWEWEGSHDAVVGLLPLIVGEFDLDIDLSSPKAILTVSTPDAGDPNEDTNQIISTEFELQGNTSQRSGYEHPRSIALGAATVQEIKKAIQDKDSTATFTGDSDTLYAHMVNGQDNFITSEFVFRISQITSKNAIVPIAFSNKGKIYSTAQLLTETNPTGLYPAGLVSAYSTVFEDQYDSSIPTGYSLGWLKQAPSITNISGNKQVITVEYWLEAWSLFYYSLNA